jgi:V8-like Glu-specific endopeptidase
MNIFTKFLIGLGVVYLGAVAYTNSGYASSFDEIATATYKLHEGAVPICSAVAVSPTQLVTANHCVGGEGLNIRFEKLDADYKPTSIDVRFTKTIRTLKEYDIAMIELKDGTLPNYVDIAKPSEVKLAFGTELVAIGYPKVMEITLTRGQYGQTVSLLELDSDMKKPFYKLTTPITGGNSGGGLYAEVDNTWKLIGLTTAGFRDVSFMNYASTVDAIAAVTASLIKLDTPKEGDGAKNEQPVKDKLINPSDEK